MASIASLLPVMLKLSVWSNCIFWCFSGNRLLPGPRFWRVALDSKQPHNSLLPPDLLMRVLALCPAPGFLTKLERLVDEAENQAGNPLRTKRFIDRLLNDEDKESAELLLGVFQQGVVHFAAAEWIPDEYQHLAQHGLVKYTKPRVAGKARAAAIYLTDQGAVAVGIIQRHRAIVGGASPNPP